MCGWYTKNLFFENGRLSGPAGPEYLRAGYDRGMVRRRFIKDMGGDQSRPGHLAQLATMNLGISQRGVAVRVLVQNQRIPLLGDYIDHPLQAFGPVFTHELVA